MRVVAGVDWSEEAFAAAQAAPRLYSLQELILVHAVDVRPFEDPFFGPTVAKQVYAEVRRSMEDSGQQLFDRISGLLPTGIPSVRRLCELGAPANVILDAIRSTAADLLVVGAQGLGRLSELVLGSVSHRVLIQAPCSTLIVKRPLESVKRVLVAVEGPDDADILQRWLRSHPFKKPVELSVMTAVPTRHFGDPVAVISHESFYEEAVKRAGQFLESVTTPLAGSHYSVKHEVVRGFPTEVIPEMAGGFDLLLVGSHGRKGLSRFFLGSVSHSLVHRVACPILVVR
ncbi:MAG: universal stress protein [Nitrospiraceae bacterium]